MARGKVSRTKPQPTTSEDFKPRRGRPRGANRIPLTKEERKERNKLNERQRRLKNSEALVYLFEVSGCEAGTSTARLLKKLTKKFKRAQKEKSIREYKATNANLEAQIASCKERLGDDYVSSEDEDEATDVPNVQESNGDIEQVTPQYARDPTLGSVEQNVDNILLSVVSPSPDQFEALEPDLVPPLSQDDLLAAFGDLASLPLDQLGPDAVLQFSPEDLDDIFGTLDSVDDPV